MRLSGLDVDAGFFALAGGEMITPSSADGSGSPLDSPAPGSDKYSGQVQKAASNSKGHDLHTSPTCGLNVPNH